MYKRLENERHSNIYFWLCWLVYTVSYFGRLNFSAALAGMIEIGALTKAEGGILGSVFFAVYGIGQLVNGFLGDKVSPFRMVSVGIVLSGLANVLMGAADGVGVMAVLWGINGFAQSMLWSPILYIITYVLTEKRTKTAGVDMTPTVPVGTFGAYLLAWAMMHFFGWRGVFSGAGILILLIAAVWICVCLKLRVEKVYATVAVGIIGDKKSVWSAFFGSGALLFVGVCAVHGMLKDGVMTWVPTMITENYPVSASFSVLLSTCLPMVNFFGAYLAVFVLKKRGFEETRTGILFFGFALLACALMHFVGKVPVVICLVLLATITASMFAVNYIYITLVPQRFAQFGIVSAVSGVLNASAYLGTAVSNYGFGLLSQEFGWGFTIISWVVLCICAIACLLCAMKHWNKFRKGA